MAKRDVADRWWVIRRKVWKDDHFEYRWFSGRYKEHHPVQFDTWRAALNHVNIELLKEWASLG